MIFDIEIDECQAQPCVNGAQCEDEINGYACQCKDGYTGSNCEQGTYAIHFLLSLYFHGIIKSY